MTETARSPGFDNKEVPLPFDTIKQTAFLGHIFDESTGMFKHLQAFADHTWFSNPIAGLVFDAIKAFYAKNRKIPSPQELERWAHLNKDAELQTLMQKEIMKSVEERRAWSVDALKEETQVWMQAKILQAAGNRASACFNTGDFPGAQQAYKEGVRGYNDAQFSLGNFKLAQDFKQLIDGQGRNAVVRFGLTGIDDTLFPKNPKGSLRLGDQTLVMAPSNHGKTSVMITTAIHNVVEDRRVLFVTHQGRDTDIRIKYIRCFFNLMTIETFKKCLLEVPRAHDNTFTDDHLKMFADIATDEIRCQRAFSILRHIGTDINTFLAGISSIGNNYYVLKKLTHWLDQRLRYASHHKAFLKVEEVVPILDRAQEECNDLNGKGFDMCIDDYPGCLQTEMNGKGNYAARQVLDIVYEAFNQTALAKNWHSLVAVQTNREGSKKASGYDGIQFSGRPREIRFLRNEDIAEAWGPITGATNVITVNRSPEAQLAHIVTYFIAKSRSSQTGIAVSCYEDFNKCVTHSDALGWISYALGHEDQRIITGFLTPNTQRALTLSDVQAKMSGEKGIDVNKVAA